MDSMLIETYTHAEQKRVQLFVDTFIRKITADAIADYAISSGRIQTVGGVLTTAGSIIGGVASNAGLPGSGVISGGMALLDETLKKDAAWEKVARMPDLSEWIEFAKTKLAPALATLFRAHR